LSKRTLVPALCLLVAALLAAPCSAADDEALKKDLTAVIALHGMPCGQVVEVRVQAESDYAASCQDGHKYRIYINAAERVVVEPLKS
jgi:hypothetical protein